VGIYDFIAGIQEWAIKKLGEFFCSQAIDKQTCLWFWYLIAPVVVPILFLLFSILCILLIGELVIKLINKAKVFI
jgi:hypothetical protein